MAFFTKKIEKRAEEATESNIMPAANSGMTNNIVHVLKHARITEKASMHQGAGVYTFDIAEGTTKRGVIQAIHALYNVTPRMVRVVKVPSKVRRSARTGKVGMKRGGRKAYVFLKRGETITIS